MNTNPELDRQKVNIHADIPGNTVKDEIFQNLQNVLPADISEHEKIRFLTVFRKDRLEQLDAAAIVDALLKAYGELREYMLYEEIKNTNPGLFGILGFNGAEEFDSRFKQQKKEIKFLINAIQPFVKEDLSFFDTLVAKDTVKDMKEIKDIEMIRKRLIFDNDTLTDKEKTIILGYLTFKKNIQQ